ncbi:MAG: TIGR03546 family protein [Balneolaceae bacterium]
MLLLKYLSKLLKELSSEAEPSQLAGGFILGMIIGLTPIMSFHNLIIVVLILVLKVNIGMALLSFTVFSGVAYLADPGFHAFGVWMLEHDGLQSLWTSIYDNEWWAMTRFYNTVVLGSFVSALLLCVPMFPLTIYLIKNYRTHIHARVQKTKLMQALKGSKIYSFYQTVNKVRG